METPTKEPSRKTEQAKARTARQAQPKVSKLPKKLLAFDLDLLELVKSGDNAQDKLLKLTGVDPLQFEQRTGFLCIRGFLCRDSANPGMFRLGIAGYDELAKRKAAEEKKARKAKASAATAAASPAATSTAATAMAGSTANGSSAEEKSYAKATASDARLTERDSPIVYVPGPEHKPAKQADVDIFELIRKGAPKNGNGVAAKIQDAIEAAPTGQSIPFEQQVETLGGRDAVKEMIERTTQAGACELCQAPFHLSVNPAENNPKYGYCFCGASYHKDCYEHLVNSRSPCVRCGKKLQIRMDKASEDAVRAVKKLFD
ncbi:MAG: hypothetical protein WCX64_02825 [Candidatus Micrarchaeia archaeon]